MKRNDYTPVCIYNVGTEVIGLKNNDSYPKHSFKGVVGEYTIYISEHKHPNLINQVENK